MAQISIKSIERLFQYRRILLSLQNEKKFNIYSHELASLTGYGSPQIRRDLMAIGYSGTPTRGYDIMELLNSISEFIDSPVTQYVAIVGLGHLGRAILDYFQGRRPRLEIRASFDNDPNKIGRIIHGCRCYHTDEIEKIITLENITVGIISVPPDDAQKIAERMIKAGVKGFLNYAPIRLQIPEGIYIENRDMIMAVEKAAYFARQQ